MSNEVKLIISKQPVPRGLFDAAVPSEPNIAVVYATGFGEVKCFDGQPLRRSQQMMSKYRFRYDVDLGTYRRTARLENTILSSQDGYRFDAELDVSFRVYDPERVVRWNIVNPLPLVYGYLRTKPLRETARQYGIRDAYKAEEAINALLAPSVQMQEGVEIFGCRIRLELDAAARGHLQEFVVVERQRAISDAKHDKAKEDAERAHDLQAIALQGSQSLERMRSDTLPEQRLRELDDAKHRTELDAIAQNGRLEAEIRERKALNGVSQDLWGLLTIHIQRHPEDTVQAMQLLSQHQLALAERKDVNDQRSLDLFRFMIDRGLVRGADIDGLRADVLGRVQPIAAPPREELPAGGGWNDPLPGSEGPVILGTVEPERRQPAEEPAEACVIPVYVAVDESVPPHYLDALNAGLGDLPTVLARNPQETAPIKLAVIGYAETVSFRMPLTSVSRGTLVPPLEARSGTRLGPVFCDLRGRITADIDSLKARGFDVRRPTLVVLAGNPPIDADDWHAEHARLTDHAAFPYVPNIVAFGVERAGPDLAARLATRPEQAFVMAGGDDSEGSASHFADFLARFLVDYGRVSLTGRPSTAFDQPSGFVRA